MFLLRTENRDRFTERAETDFVYMPMKIYCHVNGICLCCLFSILISISVSNDEIISWSSGREDFVLSFS